MNINVRSLRLPDDYGALAELLNTQWSEPTSAARLQEDDTKLYEVGQPYIDVNGLLAGYDRLRLAAITDRDELIGYMWIWRAPWTEPGHLNMTLVTHEEHQGSGAGSLLLRHAAEWAARLGASAVVTEAWDDNQAALRFAERRGFHIERHAFQSVLNLEGVEPGGIYGADRPALLERQGLRFTTLAEEPGEESERRLYELYQSTLVDIPGFTGEVPDIGEWGKWFLRADGYAPDQVLIVSAGSEYVGVTNVLHNPRTNGMYHEYTGVSRTYRGRGVGLALKVKAIELAIRRKASYIRTDNDSTNGPILAINRRLGYVPLRGSYRLIAKLEDLPRT